MSLGHAPKGKFFFSVIFSFCFYLIFLWVWIIIRFGSQTENVQEDIQSLCSLANLSQRKGRFKGCPPGLTVRFVRSLLFRFCSPAERGGSFPPKLKILNSKKKKEKKIRKIPIDTGYRYRKRISSHFHITILRGCSFFTLHTLLEYFSRAMKHLPGFLIRS